MAVIYKGESVDAEDITTCVSTLLNTVRGTMPHGRSKGIPDNIISSNQDEIEERYYVEAVDQVEMFEDRATISEIQGTFIGEDRSNLEPEVTLISGEQY